MASKCPVDHDEKQVASAPSASAECPVDHSSVASTATECPVDHDSRSIWSRLVGNSATSSAESSTSTLAHTRSLSSEREISTIPRTDEGKWVYPSEAQFFAAMARKNHNPRASDMKTIVPIHNAVNERAWSELLKWEAGQGGDQCGGVKLVNFKGRPKDLTPKARMMTWLGYTAPFDRHDWTVDRCGTQVRYVIDFYTGRGSGPSSNPSFYLDVRPALDSWEGVKMRLEGLWKSW
ncbi:cytochrome C1 heme lyase [Coniophora puteana RWD-64-598 SS2]|uniref:Holocytochrome c-type synthase n=1 Tax=Coniophora puteana (strain RWD-64-598) TaxID=741705 RepID=A0A5M3N287_CONPW|nr:cytochrome C1 heme lyase [Coniophora puteana RWD-64-598 SS2]EIW85387.1 cytochrome C1 heme lyase [Coniophora puteana RWD-64-598 SS2]